MTIIKGNPQIEIAMPDAYSACFLATPGFLDWAREVVPAGIEITRDPHVTVCFSRDNIDLNSITFENYPIILASNHSRSFKKLGNAVVLALAENESEPLRKIWEKYNKAGASWDFPDYIPHITISTKWNISQEELDSLSSKVYSGPIHMLPPKIVPLKKDK